MISNYDLNMISCWYLKKQYIKMKIGDLERSDFDQINDLGIDDPYFNEDGITRFESGTEREIRRSFDI